MKVADPAHRGAIVEKGDEGCDVADAEGKFVEIGASDDAYSLGVEPQESVKGACLNEGADDPQFAPVGAERTFEFASLTAVDGRP